MTSAENAAPKVTVGDVDSENISLGSRFNEAQVTQLSYTSSAILT